MKKEDTNDKGSGKIEIVGIDERYYFIRPENVPNEIPIQADLCILDIQERTATQDGEDYSTNTPENLKEYYQKIFIS